MLCGDLSGCLDAELPDGFKRQTILFTQGRLAGILDVFAGRVIEAVINPYFVSVAVVFATHYRLILAEVFTRMLL
jgi:hypothetical protein